jgi:hypothetical protein
MIQRLPVLLCSHCQQHTVLPYRNLRGTLEVEPYWPAEDKTVSVACQHCQRLTVHWERDIRMLGVEAESPNQAPSIFWRVEFWCSHPGCDLPIIVYTRTEDEVTLGSVARRAYDVTPKPQCPAGHDKADKVESIIRVEWTGEDGYLT